MKGGATNLTITEVPDSGTGELNDLTGSTAINMDGKRFYDFDYTLDGTA